MKYLKQNTGEHKKRKRKKKSWLLKSKSLAPIACNRVETTILVAYNFARKRTHRFKHVLMAALDSVKGVGLLVHARRSVKVRVRNIHQLARSHHRAANYHVSYEWYYDST